VGVGVIVEVGVIVTVAVGVGTMVSENVVICPNTFHTLLIFNILKDTTSYELGLPEGNEPPNHTIATGLSEFIFRELTIYAETPCSIITVKPTPLLLLVGILTTSTVMLEVAPVTYKIEPELKLCVYPVVGLFKGIIVSDVEPKLVIPFILILFSKLRLPLIVKSPIVFNEPVTLTLPVKTCVSSNELPKFEEPLIVSVNIFVIDELNIYCCAVKEPLTTKLPLMV
jgi:hypothetical protein